jgi:RNA polymerase sigma factor (sigma-70 family)
VATRQPTQVLDHFRTTVLRRDAAALSDGQLLDCFLRNHDEAAFAALVRQHGPMVWGVCRRILANHHDAEDAFQATFLVLVRRAASVVPREMVANWLYGVAHQTALKARAMAAKRRARETPMAHLPEPEAAGRDPWDDLRPVLDQELSRLPDKYRVALVLCDLEGKTRKAAARQLRIPEGTVSSRLSTARALLAKRLARHGLALSAGSLAALLTENAAAAPGAVVASTIQNACLFAAGQAAGDAIPAHVVALTEGVCAMSPHKLKIATLAVLTAGLIYFVGLPFFPPAAAGQGDPAAAARAQDRQTPADSRKNVLSFHARLEKVDGKGRIISARVVPALEQIYPVDDLIIGEKSPEVQALGHYINLVGRKQTTQLVNLPVVKDAKITTGGKAMKLADLKVGMAVTLQLTSNATGLAVIGIRSDGRGADQPARDENAFFLQLLEVEKSSVPYEQEKKKDGGQKKSPERDATGFVRRVQEVYTEAYLKEKQTDRAKKDQAALQGTWHVTTVETFEDGAGRRTTAKGARWVFLGDQIATFDPRSSDPENDGIYRFELKSGPRNKEIRLVGVEGREKGRVYLGVYALEGNGLRLLIQKRPGAGRPTGFDVREDAGIVLWEFRRTPPR